MDFDFSTSIKLPRIFLEIMVIVGSILLAFAIDAWWENSKQSTLEQGLLRSLENGFEENRRLVDGVIAEARSQHRYISRFIGMTPEEAGQIPPDSIYLFLKALWRPNYAYLIQGGLAYGGNLNNSAILATLQAGQLSLLSDNRLLNAIAEWQGVADNLADRSEEVIVLEREVLASIARHPELQPALARLDEAGEVRSFAMSPPKLSGMVARQIRQDNELMSRAARKGFYSRIQIDFLEQLGTQADSVLAFIRANMK